MPTVTLLLNAVLEVFLRAVKKNKLKDTNWKGESQVIHLQRTGFFYKMELKYASERLLELVREFGKIAGYKSKHQSRLYTQTISCLRKKIVKSIPLTIVAKKKMNT